MVFCVSSNKGSFELPYGVFGGDIFVHIWQIAGLEAANAVMAWCANACPGDIYSHDLFTVHMVKPFFEEEADEE